MITQKRNTVNFITDFENENSFIELYRYEYSGRNKNFYLIIGTDNFNDNTIEIDEETYKLILQRLKNS